MSHIYTIDLTDDIRYVAYTMRHRSGVLELISHAVNLADDSNFLRHGDTPKWVGYCDICAIGTDIQRMEILPDSVNVWEVLEAHGLVCKCD